MPGVRLPVQPVPISQRSAGLSDALLHMAYPCISVVIPTFNRRDFICAAIDSVLGQTRRIDEVIVVDDGSTDGTDGLLCETYGNRIRYIRQANAGAAAARNHGMAESRGDLIAFQDSDDVWLPAKIELQCSFLQQNPQVEFVFSDMSNFTGKPDFSVAEIKSPAIHAYLSANSSRIADLLECLVVENVVPTPSVILTREAANRVGAFDETLRVAEDLDYWLRVARCCRCGFVDRVLVARRRHSSNLIAESDLRNVCLLKVLRKTASELDPSVCASACALIDKKTCEISYDLASALLKNGDLREAATYFERARDAGNKSAKLRAKLLFTGLLLRFTFGRRNCSQLGEP